MYLHTFGFAYLFTFFTYTLDVGYYNGDVPVNVVAAGVVCVGRILIGVGVLVVVVFTDKFLLKLI